MGWLYRSPIPVGRRGVISSLKWFLPAFATCRGREEGFRSFQYAPLHIFGLPVRTLYCTGVFLNEAGFCVCKVVCVNLTLLDDDGYRGEEGDERIPDSGIEIVLGTRGVHQCFGSWSVMDPAGQWIRIRNRIRTPDPESGSRQKWPTKIKNKN
jgi:hypothetical protein